MGRTVEMVQLEAAINRLRAAQPAVGYVLPAALSQLAEVYARMIYFRQARVEVEALAPPIQALLALWLDGAADAPQEDGGCEARQ